MMNSLGAKGPKTKIEPPIWNQEDRSSWNLGEYLGGVDKQFQLQRAGELDSTHASTPKNPIVAKFLVTRVISYGISEILEAFYRGGIQWKSRILGNWKIFEASVAWIPGVKDVNDLMLAISTLWDRFGCSRGPRFPIRSQISALSDFAGNIPKLHKDWETYGDTVGLRVSKSKRFRSEVGGATEVQIGRGRIYRGEEAQGSNRHVAWLMWRVLYHRLRWNWNLNCIIQQKLN